MRSDGYWFFPINGTLWFLRELFIVSFLFPVPLLVVRYIKPQIGLPLLAMTSILLDYEGCIPGTYNALVYFSIGAYLGFYKIVVLDLCRNYKIMWLVLYTTIVVIDLKYCQGDSGFLNEVHRMGFWVGSMFIFGFTTYFPEKIKGIDLPSLAMFIFLSHSMLRKFPIFISYRYLINYPSVGYIFNIIMTLSLCLASYLVMKKMLGVKTFSILTGGR